MLRERSANLLLMAASPVATDEATHVINQGLDLLKEVGDICLNQTADKDTIFEMFDFYRECMGV